MTSWLPGSASLATMLAIATAGTVWGADPVSSHTVAGEVDAIIARGLTDAGVDIAPRANDEDFLRRISLDLAGTLPDPGEVALFGLDPDPGKRAKVVERLLKSDAYAENWARYWRDVVVMRATNQRARLAVPQFEEWLTEQFRGNRPWDEVATDLLTASGDVRDAGDTMLIFAHDGDAKEIASEVSRIFLGIQIQCANCHDHPYDAWKREQFHELAAYFPRVRVRPVREENRVRSYEVVSFDRAPSNGRGLSILQNPESLFRRLDRNRDGKLTKAEVGGSSIARLMQRVGERADANEDGALTLAEIKAIRPPQQVRQRQETEYFMPNLEEPDARGERMRPVFFVDGEGPRTGLNDLARRTSIADQLTAKNNPWFAKAYVNRVWSEMLGEGFVMPLDDLGPAREARFPAAIDRLAKGFADSGYDVKWLFRTIAMTDAYQRQLRARSPGEADLPFASALPTRLRADQVFESLLTVMGVDERALSSRGPQGRGGAYRRRFGPRAEFAQLFGFDPSTPQDDVSGNVPQALFLMNSPLVNGLVRATPSTRLGRLLTEFEDDGDAIEELYLLVLSRQPSARERKVAASYVLDVGNRREAYEDLLWSLLNSTEFVSRR